MILKRLWIAMTFLLGACATLPAPEAGGNPGVESAPPQEPASAAPTATTAPTETQAVLADLEDYGPAPELENEVWLNTDRALRLEDLRGKVVLLDMWTFG